MPPSGADSGDGGMRISILVPLPRPRATFGTADLYTRAVIARLSRAGSRHRTAWRIALVAVGIAFVLYEFFGPRSTDGIATITTVAFALALALVLALADPWRTESESS
jgi:hypothetical protein